MSATRSARFARTPGLTAVAILSLAIGIGANTAIFSVASALLLRPLPYQDADRLAILWNRSPGLNIAEDWFSTAQYFDIKTSHSGFEDRRDRDRRQLQPHRRRRARARSARCASRRTCCRCSARGRRSAVCSSRQKTARAVPARRSSVTAPGRAGTARIAASSARSITLNGQPFEIVGVLPEGFALPREVMPTLGVAEDGEIFLPLPLAANAATIRDARGLQHPRAS